MMASVEGFNRTPIACKRKFNSLYKQYRDGKMAHNVGVSESDRSEGKFYECLDHWWHFSGRIMKHVSKNEEESGMGSEVNKSRRREIQAA